MERRRYSGRGCQCNLPVKSGLVVLLQNREVGTNAPGKVQIVGGELGVAVARQTFAGQLHGFAAHVYLRLAVECRGLAEVAAGNRFFAPLFERAQIDALRSTETSHVAVVGFSPERAPFLEHLARVEMAEMVLGTCKAVGRERAIGHQDVRMDIALIAAVFGRRPVNSDIGGKPEVVKGVANEIGQEQLLVFNTNLVRKADRELACEAGIRASLGIHDGVPKRLGVLEKGRGVRRQQHLMPQHPLLAPVVVDLFL